MIQDENGFIESLYLNEYERLFNVAYRKTMSIEVAEDLVQETFLLAIFKRGNLIKHPHPDAWLILTLRNLIANEQRAQSYTDIPLDEAIGVSEKAEEISFSELLPDHLESKERDALILRFEQRLSYREMSEQLGVSEEACRKRVVRAVNKCKKAFRVYT